MRNPCHAPRLASQGGTGPINLARGFKDVTNVYTQHEPQLKSILDRVTRGAPAPTVCEGFAP